VPAKTVRSFDPTSGWQPPLRGAASVISLDELAKLSSADIEGLQLLHSRLQEEAG
jgi:hypothetical protein